ncbi:repressor of RNA polymerase III transcription MAF1, partial [Klebsiella aerogenes]|uniref:repressor of RNA polymerase III transcription MAF1 n=1 Tax=Klebsiella aerogenes TaxID=548 RepID=UPI001CC7DD81
RAVLGRMPAYVPGGSFTLSDALWALLDAAIDLSGCAIFSYVAKDDNDPFLTGALWSMNFFFLNKARKQVAFLFVKARSRLAVAAAQPPSH